MSNSNSPFQVFRFCPRCGSSGFVKADEKSLKCGVCGFRYYFNMSASVAAVIRNEHNEVLFTIRKHEPAAGLLDLPGGFVDPGETAEEAVKREIREELNLQVVGMSFYASFPNQYLFGDIYYQTLDLVFTCMVDSFECIRPDDDVAGYVFRNPAEVKAEEIGLVSIRNIVRGLE